MLWVVVLWSLAGCREAEGPVDSGSDAALDAVVGADARSVEEDGGAAPDDAVIRDATEVFDASAELDAALGPDAATGEDSGMLEAGAPVDAPPGVDAPSVLDAFAPSLDAASVLPRCTSSIGLTVPPTECTAADPCLNNPLGGGTPITSPGDVPVCRTSEAGRPAYDDGAPATVVDGWGRSRYSCVYRPPLARPASQRPLVLFFHGTGGTAGNIYNATSLRTKAIDFAFYGATRRGMFLVSVQGRNLHWPFNDADGSHHDIYHRDFRAGSGNHDISYVDYLVDSLVAEGSVDPRRIYVMGWSNGGFFAQMYAIARHEIPTAGGNRVAAAAVFTAADPFHDSMAGESPSCRLSPYPRSSVPIFNVGRSCDIVPCDAAQAASLAAAGVHSAGVPGFDVTAWMSDLATRVMDPNGSRRIVAADGRTAAFCAGPAVCTPALAYVNHLRWPDGVADGSGMDHEADMLAFLREHPLP